MRKLLAQFSVRDLVLIAAMAAVGIAVKPVVVPLAHLVSAPLMIPGGALAGGLYMMWIVVAFGLTGKRGTATLVGLVQSLLAMVAGISGSHGAISLISYTIPGLLVDGVFLLLRRRLDSMPLSVLAGILANLGGTLCVNLIFFSLPAIPLLLSICAAAFSGGAGGMLSWLLLSALGKYGLLPDPEGDSHE